MAWFSRLALVLCLTFGTSLVLGGQETPPVASVDGQPLGSNARRLLDSLAFLGAPVDAELRQAVEVAARERDAAALQRALDPRVLASVWVNPEYRVRVERGPGPAILRQGAYTPVILKVYNDSSLTRALRIRSPQAGPVYAGASLGILERQAQTELNRDENTENATDRFLEVEVYDRPPMTARLSGLSVEYVLALVYSHEAGRREAILRMDLGQGTEDLGFRGELPVLFEVKPAIQARLRIRDWDGAPSVARLEFRDREGRVYPPQAKRLAPDFFFQPQVYRFDGETVALPPGKLTMWASRGPEYRVVEREIEIPSDSPGAPEIEIDLERWIDPSAYGFYGGDHHIHGAGCSHYQSPTQGVGPSDMFRQVKGEGLNVGCVLTWGPCFDHQREFFSPAADTLSDALTVLKYDLEISGFGSAALGHVCLLNLKDQTYPGSGGGKTHGWPTWTVPVMRWCQAQGGVTGYPHSAIHVDPESASEWLLERWDADGDTKLSEEESLNGVLPSVYSEMDRNGDGLLSKEELKSATDLAADRLPNLALPSMDGGGAMEIVVSAPEGVCDFISAMDTARIPEWNLWYHLMNCGLPIKLSGETDFPCMSSRRVGAGRVYVRLGAIDRIDFEDWARGLGDGRSYVSDGYAHALEFTVDGQGPGLTPVIKEREGVVRVNAAVAFAPETPKSIAQGRLIPPQGRRMSGDTVRLHGERTNQYETGGSRRVEIVVNGEVKQSVKVPADGEIHELEFDVEIDRSSWVALRQFPQLHTNPVVVQVGDNPIRASRSSALWLAESVRILWKNRHRFIAEDERPAARSAYDRAIETYLRIAEESAE